MSKDWYQDIVELHKSWGQDVGEVPKIPPKPIEVLRAELIQEEVRETLEALEEQNLTDIADGIVDSIVVLLGAAVSYGIDTRPVWDAVHQANMSKIGGPIRSDGKQLKPEGWKPPRIQEILDKQGATEEWK